MTIGIDAIARSMSGPASLSGRAACAAMLACAAFGGLSGVSQTNTVIKNAGLSIRHYVLWKLLHAALAAAILLIITASYNSSLFPRSRLSLYGWILAAGRGAYSIGASPPM